MLHIPGSVCLNFFFCASLKSLDVCSWVNISEICVFINKISFSNENWERQNHILEKRVCVIGSS